MPDFDIHSTGLGKNISIPQNYDPSLLFRIPRSENRIQYQLIKNNLPFVGFDVWNCYEVSFLTDNGLPINGVIKLIYSANSEYIVESKSLKIYLFSLNMERFGRTELIATQNAIATITKDLQQLLEIEVSLSFFRNESPTKKAFEKFCFVDLSEFIPLYEKENIVFSHFTETPSLLSSTKTQQLETYTFHTDLLRSNCRVTNQPDWGDLYVHISTMHRINFTSVLEYIISFRKENHFHEEVVEMIYKRFFDAFHPNELMVAAMYTRRGGIDINPIRASHLQLIDSFFISPTHRIEKNCRQ
jgi:7-cyano-7-deazaguanine reductase